MRTLILASILLFSSVASAQEPSKDQATAPITTVNPVTVIIKRSATEMIRFSVRANGDFRCNHLWRHEKEANSLSDPNKPEKAKRERQTETLVQGTLSQTDCKALNEILTKLEFEKLPKVSIDQLQDNPKTSTYVVIVVISDENQLPTAYLAEFQKYGKDAAQVEPFVKTILSWTEQLK